MAADQAGLAQGDSFLRSIEARGGTELGPGLQGALEAMAGRGEPPRAGVVVIITGGEVGQESELLTLLQQKLGDARVFTVGIDTAVNEAFLLRLASIGGGTCSCCAPGTALEEALRGRRRESGAPGVTDLALEGAKRGFRFPAWQIEGAQPTLIRVTPPWAKAEQNP